MTPPVLFLWGVDNQAAFNMAPCILWRRGLPPAGILTTARSRPRGWAFVLVQPHTAPSAEHLDPARLFRGPWCRADTGAPGPPALRRITRGVGQLHRPFG